MNTRYLSVSALFQELARAGARRQAEIDERTRARVKAAVEAQRLETARRVRALKIARAALVRAGLSEEAATEALYAIDHQRVPFVRIDYYGGDIA